MDIRVEQVETRSVACIRRIVKVAEMREFYDEVFKEVPALIEREGGTITGPPFGWYHGRPSDVVDVAAGFPVAGLAAGALGGDVVVDEQVGGRAVVATHIGSYEQLMESYEAVERWMDEHGEVPRDDMWEEYVSNPVETSEADLETRIVLPTR